VAVVAQPAQVARGQVVEHDQPARQAVGRAHSDLLPLTVERDQARDLQHGLVGGQHRPAHPPRIAVMDGDLIARAAQRRQVRPHLLGR